MKKHFNRIIALILVLLVALSLPVAAENTEFEGEPLPGESETELLDFDSLDGSTVVGRMYICFQQTVGGHAWIYIESDFGGEMPVGIYTLAPYEGVSVGTFALTRSDGMGLYYNVEAYCAMTYGLKNKAWLGMEITKDQLLKANEAIKKTNHWDPFFNCTYFAAKIWNRVSDKKIVPLLFPFVIRWQILANGGTKDIEMKPVTAEQCFKQRKRGDKAYLEQCSEKTLDSKLG